MADLYPHSYDNRYQQYTPSNDDSNNDSPPTPPKSSDHQQSKSETKPQATFLTKLYAYVE